MIDGQSSNDSDWSFINQIDELHLQLHGQLVTFAMMMINLI